MREREKKRRYYIRASHFTPISGRGRFCPTCAGPPPSVVRSTRPDFEHHLGLQLATSSCMVSRSTWTTRATKPRHLQLADLRRMRSIRPTAPRNPAFGRVEGENGLAESPKRASEMSEGARGPCPTQNAPPSMRRHCGQGPPRDLDAQGDNAAPTVHALPTDPRAAGDGVSSRVSSTAARLARMAATALSIAASSGRRAARCCRSASNQSGHAAGRKTSIASAPLRATPVRFSHTHPKTPDGG